MSRKSRSRRDYLAAIGTVAFASVAGCSGNSNQDSPTNDEATATETTTETTGTSTPADNDEVTETQTSPEDDSVEQGSKLWTFNPGSDLVPIGAPVIGKGTVYFGSGRGAFDTGKAHLFGVDAGSGNQELKVTLERQVYAPALDSGTAYVPTREKVYAVTLASGNTAWSSGVPEQATDVTLVEDLVVVRVFKQNQGGNSELYALSTGSGQQQWKYAPGEPLSAPTVVNGTIYVGAGKATVTAINADSGDEQWSTSVAEVSESPDPLQPAIEGDQAVFPFVTGATEGMFVGVNLGSRSKAWSKSADSRPKGAALLNGQAFCTFGSGLGSGTNAYDAVSGSQNWSWTFDGPVYSPTVGDDALYVGCGAASGDGKKVVAIDTGSGQNLWSLGTAGSPTELTYADSRLYGKISNEEYYVAISV